MGAAEAAGFARIIYVYPSTWQSYVFGGKRPEDSKAASMNWCRTELDIEPEDHNVADAIALGVYAYKTQ